jgi:hypothetical protein
MRIDEGGLSMGLKRPGGQTIAGTSIANDTSSFLYDERASRLVTYFTG